MNEMDLTINVDALTQGLTQSEMQMWDNCPEKWFLRYNLLLTGKNEFAWPTTYGGWIHSALEEMYQSRMKRWSLNTPMPKLKGMLPQDVLEKYEYYARLAKIQMDFYASYYKHDMKVWKPVFTETIADIEYRGVRLTGMVDMLVKSLTHGGYYVVDHKTSYALTKSVIQGWDFRFQFMFYCWLGWKMWGDEYPIKGYFINALKKPQLRQGVNETIDAFLQRVQSDQLQSPNKYLYRERNRLTRGALIRFQKEMLDPKIDRIRAVRSATTKDSIKRILMRNKNTDHCQHYNKSCQFLRCCQHGLAAEQHLFTVRKAKHQELTEEPTDD